MKRFISFISALAIALSIGIPGKVSIASAKAKLPTVVDQAEVDRLSKMTVDDLNKVAIPMPKEALRFNDMGSYTSVDLGDSECIPVDSNLYYWDIDYRTSIVPEFGVVRKYYRFLYVKSEARWSIGHYYYSWTYSSTKGMLDKSCGIASWDWYNPSMWDEYFGEGSKVPSSKLDVVKRVSGSNRKQTARFIAEELTKGEVTKVILATADNYPDALSGAFLAGNNCPILLVGKTPEASTDALEFIKNNMSKDGRVYMLGGSTVIPDSIEKKLREYGYHSIDRIGGNDRYDTNIKASYYRDVPKGKPVIIATGDNFPDALSISSVSAINGMPIFLAKKDGMSDELMGRLKDIQPSRVYMVGGESVLSSGVKDKISDVTGLGASDIVRLGGKDRYETSAMIANYFKFDDKAIIATGKDFPDALVGSSLAAKLNAPIILVDNGSIAKQKDVVIGNNLNNLYILGGSKAISEILVNELLK